MKFVLNTYNRNTSEQELLDDVNQVALKLVKTKITTREYDENGKYSSSTISKRFGSWSNALKKCGLQAKVQRHISNKELFENIEQVWIKLGRQPMYDEIKQPLSEYSTGPYAKRFGSWRSALEEFVVYTNSNSVIEEVNVDIFEDISEREVIYKHKTKRTPSERLKVQVLMRDGNKCRLCGIIVSGDNIHFDHIKPWSRGGETILENLQVLCATHNLAKGDLDYDDI